MKEEGDARDRAVSDLREFEARARARRVVKLKAVRNENPAWTNKVTTATTNSLRFKRVLHVCFCLKDPQNPTDDALSDRMCEMCLKNADGFTMRATWFGARTFAELRSLLASEWSDREDECGSEPSEMSMQCQAWKSSSRWERASVSAPLQRGMHPKITNARHGRFCKWTRRRLKAAYGRHCGQDRHIDRAGLTGEVGELPFPGVGAREPLAPPLRSAV
ncbi:uncharacterized protein LAESUDRAFT_710397 [Laetiporus sulphureus 93-53]|uniref:Uncharacterized protein n=1 Tax=Laetiporus sulphureus 93-53 TaxID=1314785 RepID=A0A165HKA3_9APHY|nr:uncharacterized protein LAESUDRAFT_710397 [Laetiporus sulphureus 93-53]KZT11841.1 hypothetical protein LAESUDRAFT_710397 [Laetiporus sulphureus 93-53]